MRTSSVKSGVLALTIVALLSMPVYGATSQERGREGGRVSRFVERVLRFVGGAFDGIIVPLP